MGTLFSRDWVETLAARWNADAEMVAALTEAGFGGVIGLGLTEAEAPAVLLEIRHGRVVRAGEHPPLNRPQTDWDLRADPERWQYWQVHGLPLSQLGIALTRGQLEFREGDYRRVLRTPALARSLLRFFQLLQRRHP